MRYLGAILLIVIAQGDPCAQFCIQFLQECSENFVCSNNSLCGEPIWSNPQRTTFCTYSSKLCNTLITLRCEEAAHLLTYHHERQADLRSLGATLVFDNDSAVALKPAKRIVKLISAGRKHDSRPGMVVKLPDSQDKKVAFRLMFDTGSGDSHMALDSDEFPGYIISDKRTVAFENERLCYGVLGSCFRTITSIGRVQESVLVDTTKGFSNSFDAEFALTLEPDGDVFPDGLLGAGLSSNFAKNHGKFAYVPKGDGQLHIGVIDEVELAEKYCEEPAFVDIPLQTSVSRIHWLVAGHNSAISESGHEGFIIDTGANGLMLSANVYDEIISVIKALGGDITGSHFPKVRDCKRYTEFPTINVRIPGVGHTSFEIAFSPTDYVKLYRDGSCLLEISPAALTPSGDGKLLGMEFIRKTVIIFNQRERKISICNIKNTFSFTGTNKYP
jgi:hypothetical protein